MIPPTTRIGAEIIMVRPMKHDRLDLLDVVRVAGDQRRRAERVDLDLARSVSTLRKIALADVAPEAHRDPARRSRRAMIDGDADDERDDEHQRAGPEDVVGVALGDAVVDDVAVEVGQVQVADRAWIEQEPEDDREVAARRAGGTSAAGRSSLPLLRRRHAGVLRRELRMDGLAGGPNGPEAAEERLEVVVVEPRRAARRGARDAVPSCHGRPRAGLRRDHQDDPAVLVVVLALDEAALLHPADDPGRARDGDVERVGELATSAAGRASRGRSGRGGGSGSASPSARTGRPASGPSGSTRSSRRRARR